MQEEKEVNEFFIIIEKDPQQEDFLQGRMPGNPYSCKEAGLGPLMRDIKNKICTGIPFTSKSLLIFSYTRRPEQTVAMVIYWVSY